MRHLDLSRWPRRASFDHFRRLDDPYFNTCTRLDVTELLALRSRLPGTLSLAYHHLVLRAAHAVEPFRYRFDGDGRGDRVVVLDRVHGSTTVLRPDESIAFVRLPWCEDHAQFVAAALPQVRAVQRGEPVVDPEAAAQDLVHFTTLPWFDFSSFSHPRNRRAPDGIPKVAFGRIVSAGGRATMAMGIEVHHALMDGLHVGRLVQMLQGWLDDPGPLLLA